MFTGTHTWPSYIKLSRDIIVLYLCCRRPPFRFNLRSFAKFVCANTFNVLFVIVLMLLCVCMCAAINTCICVCVFVKWDRKYLFSSPLGPIIYDTITSCMRGCTCAKVVNSTPRLAHIKHMQCTEAKSNKFNFIRDFYISNLFLCGGGGMCIII